MNRILVAPDEVTKFLNPLTVRSCRRERESLKQKTGDSPAMLQDSNLQLMAIINDLDALISEIDNNPRLSSWVVRLVLKSIKDKAKKESIALTNSQADLEDLLDAFPY